MNFEYNNKKYEVVIEKKNNKNTYIRVKEDLKIYVSTSYLTPKIMIKSLIGKNKQQAQEIIENYENMLDEKEYNSDLLGELNVYDEIYKQVYFYKKELAGHFDFKMSSSTFFFPHI